MRGIRLTESDRVRIADAVRVVEKGSAAEIVVVINPRAGRYASRVLGFALLLTAAVSVLLLVAAPDWMKTPVSGDWGSDAVLAPPAFLAGQLAAFVLGLAAVRLPFLLRLVVPGRLCRETVRYRAEEAFSRQRIGATAGETGVLVYIAVFERRVELLTDRAIDRLFPGPTWQPFVDSVTAGIRAGRFVDALVDALLAAGDRLAAGFPVRPGDRNELPDNPVTEGSR